MKTTAHGLRLRHIATCLSAALALGTAEESSAITRNVSSCLDNGSVGTLRQVVGVSTSGDTVDLSGLPMTCSTITLAMGEISIPQLDLTLAGPTTRTLTITTNLNGRILHHTGSGTLQINDLTLSKGRYYTLGDAVGGCISSSGPVTLFNSTVTGCVAVSGTYGGPASFGGALGGAIFGNGYVTLNSSRVTGNAAYTYTPGGLAEGGGINASRLFISNSTLSGNSCSAAAGGTAAGGGAHARYLSLQHSTVDSNKAQMGGGIAVDNGVSGRATAIGESTISGNSASVRGGGIMIGTGDTLDIRESTVAFNIAPNYAGIFSVQSVFAQSSIIARNANTSSGVIADLYIQGSGNILTGDHNLIVSSNQSLSDTLKSDPQLAPLSNHGGPTRTHALSSGSPAIDHGNNAIGQSTDQREGAYAREVPTGKPDIGAYERQVNDDEIFYGGFD